jgi:hypothetical protein
LSQSKEQKEKDVYNNLYTNNENFLGAIKDGKFKE